METVRVNICYRPLRIAWAIHSSDIDGFRRAVRLSHTMWGGRINPIVFADRKEDAKELIDTFRADVIWPLGDSPEVSAFPDQFPHLINPILSGELFSKGRQLQRPRAHLLDIQNAVVHSQDKPEWKALKERGFRRFLWEATDPLADVFLIQFGAYPTTEETGVDYLDTFTQASGAVDVNLDANSAIPIAALDHPSIAYLARHGLTRHYTVRSGWDHPGFFVGDASSIDDLASWWNLRAADISLQFVDPRHESRYADIAVPYDQRLRGSLAHLEDYERQPAIWSRGEDSSDPPALFGDKRFVRCRVSSGTWNGLNVRAPMMILGESSALGVIDENAARSKLSFALGTSLFPAKAGSTPSTLSPRFP